MAQLSDLDWLRLSSATARECADAFSDFHLAVTPDSGRLLSPWCARRGRTPTAAATERSQGSRIRRDGDQPPDLMAGRLCVGDIDSAVSAGNRR